MGVGIWFLLYYTIPWPLSAQVRFSMDLKCMKDKDENMIVPTTQRGSTKLLFSLPFVDPSRNEPTVMELYPNCIQLRLSIILFNGEPPELVHYVALIDNHGIVRIIHCRWRCGSLVTQRPLLHMAYQLLLSLTYQFRSFDCAYILCTSVLHHNRFCIYI